MLETLFPLWFPSARKESARKQCLLTQTHRHHLRHAVANERASSQEKLSDLDSPRDLCTVGQRGGKFTLNLGARGRIVHFSRLALERAHT